MLGQIQTKALQSQQDINLVKSQIAAKQREIRMLELTSKEVSSVPEHTKVYEGVGKM